MKFNNIIKPIAFISIFFIILSILSLFFLKETPKNDIGFEEKNTIDYLVIGDSEAYTSISPMEIWNKYGFTGYNLGVPGQRLQKTYYSLKKVLKNQKPKVIMLETNSAYRVFGVYEETNKILRSILENNFAVYKYHNRWKKFNFINNGKANANINKSKTNILKGFRYNNKVKSYIKGSYVKETDVIEKINEIPMYYLNKIVKLCNENNIRLILYTSPSPVNWNYKKHNGIEVFAKENKLPLLDLNLKNDELKIDWLKDTYDKGDHLNFSGAKKVTNYIGNYLAKNTNLIDHRQDKKYESWNDLWKKYLKIINKGLNKK